MSELEDVMLAEVDGLLARWRREYAGRPAEEAEHLWLLALEREQIVAVAYREESVAGRVDALALGDDLRSTLRQTLVWIWKDEELHAEYLRGVLLQRGGLASSMVVYGRQLQGALSGWVTATEHHRDPRTAPLRTGAASVLVAVAGATGRIPRAMQHELRFQTFRRYCELNVVLEMTAERAYRRLVELATTDDEREIFARIRDDEQRHTDAFRVLASALTEADDLADGWTEENVIDALSGISVWFVPASLRSGLVADVDDDRARTFGTGAPVVVRSGRSDRDKLGVLEDVLDRAGLGERATGARTAAIRVSFMLGYDRADRSNVNDPELVAGVARYLRWHGIEDVAVLEAPTVYGNLFGHRSVAEVARYFGFESADHRIVDIGDDLRRFRFERGLVQEAISATWVDADLRIVMSKLRTDPTEFARPLVVDARGHHRADRRDVLRQPPGGLPLRHDDGARRRPARLRARRRVGAGCRRAVRRHGVHASGRRPPPLCGGRRADRRRGRARRPRHHRPAPGTDRAPRPSLVRPPGAGRDRRRRTARTARRAARRPRVGGVACAGNVVVSRLRVSQQSGGAVRAGHGRRRLSTDRVRRHGDTRDPMGLTARVRPARTVPFVRAGDALMGSLRAQGRGLVGAVRRGDAGALALAVNDSRTFVRALFLASAVRLEVLPFLAQPRTLGELADRTGATRADRLTAWLDVGVALHELRHVDGRYALRGRRAKAIAAGNPVLTAHYRSMLDYQVGPYDELAELLRSGPDDGRDDLDRHATTIAEVSRAAAPFVLPFLQEITTSVPAARVLDIGCGTGVYLQAMLDVAPHAAGVGIDLAPDVIADARTSLQEAGLGARAEFAAGDARDHLATTTDRYDVVTLINNVYYFDREERIALYRRIRSVLTASGELVAVTMVTPGSPASVHLHWMLVTQAGHASLPADGEVERDLRGVGFTTVETTRLVPGEPFVGIRARR